MMVAHRTNSPSPDNLAVEWKPSRDGAGELAIAYEGPLASRDGLMVHAGTWRADGQRWSETQDLPLRREGPGRWVGRIPVKAGKPVRAIELAFRSGSDWDNGGMAPLGYYEWTIGERKLAVH
jgi:hypothetical protein